jgi:hypothetical protein
MNGGQITGRSLLTPTEYDFSRTAVAFMGSLAKKNWIRTSHERGVKFRD